MRYYIKDDMHVDAYITKDEPLRMLVEEIGVHSSVREMEMGLCGRGVKEAEAQHHSIYHITGNAMSDRMMCVLHSLGFVERYAGQPLTVSFWDG